MTTPDGAVSSSVLAVTADGATKTLYGVGFDMKLLRLDGSEWELWQANGPWNTQRWDGTTVCSLGSTITSGQLSYRVLTLSNANGTFTFTLPTGTTLYVGCQAINHNNQAHGRCYVPFKVSSITSWTYTLGGTMSQSFF